MLLSHRFATAAALALSLTLAGCGRSDNLEQLDAGQKDQADSVKVSFRGSVMPEGAKDEDFKPNEYLTCRQIGSRYLAVESAISIETQAAADALEEKKNVWNAVPLDADEETERKTLAFLTDEDRVKALEESARIKTMLKDLALTVFTPHDARRFFIADNRDEARNMSDLAKFLREEIFKDIRAPKTPVTQTPESLQKNVYDELNKFLDYVVDVAPDDQKSVKDVFTERMRAEMVNGLEQDRGITDAQQTLMSLAQEYDGPIAGDDAEPTLKEAFVQALKHIKTTSGVVIKITYKAGNSCRI